MTNPSQRFRAELGREMRRAAKRLIDENPEYAGFTYKADVFAYRKRPKGFSAHPERVVQAMLLQSDFLALTNEKIAERMSDWYAPYKVSTSVMHRPLHRSAQAAIQVLFDQNGLDITVDGKDTLSKLKTAIRSGRRLKNCEGLHRGEIAISDAHVVANGRTFTIEKARRHPSIRVQIGGRRQYLRVDHLRAMLGGNP